MASWFRLLPTELSTLCTRQSLSRLYSTLPPRPKSSKPDKWGIGASRPRSILEDDDTPIDLTEDDEVVNGARPNTPPLHLRQPPTTGTPHEWKHHREALRTRFPDGWSPPRKVSREAMDGLRQLHHLDPEKFTTPVLAAQFKVSPEAVRRILKSKWEPSSEKKARLAERERKVREEARVKISARKRREREEQEELIATNSSLERAMGLKYGGGTRGIHPRDYLKLE
ncbi:hypothetical protein BDQ12DRAFT_367108 [Crucibulum laeve]|uniref:Required for respiratory growth protein 9, mitochondrial n=1 Tax=Crucibulum laeve TaxID=68775 RepID=A0A5C3LMQ1_9AGAR|nr:hypothetical protein BDQ12DRAFT_367108 [Crucibulum laeve]